MIFVILFLIGIIGIVGAELVSNLNKTETNEEEDNSIPSKKEKPNWWNKSSFEVFEEIRKCSNAWQGTQIVFIYTLKVIARIFLIVSGFAALAIYIPY